MGNGNWYSTGFDAADQEKDERERRRNTPWRFFLKQGQAAEIVFLDDFSVTHKITLPNGDEIERPIVPFCFPAGAPVLTADGVKPIEAVGEEDSVLRKSGTWGEVAQIHRRNYTGHMMTVRVRKSNIPLRGTAGHKIPVVEIDPCIHKGRNSRNRKYCLPSCRVSCLNAGREYKITEKCLGDLTEHDFVLVPGMRNSPVAAEVETPTKTGPTIRRVDEQLAWLLGIYVAEGHNHRGPVFSLHEDETDFVVRISEAMEGIFGLKAHPHKHPNSRELQVEFYSTEIGAWFESMCGKGAANKKFPSELLKSPQPIRLAMLNGYIDGDGHHQTCSDGTDREMCTTISETLAYQVRSLAIDMGHKPNFYVKEAGVDSRGVKYSRVWSISWSRSAWGTHGFMIEGSMAVPVVSIEAEEVVDLPVFNIGVQDEHYYTVSGIAVGNSIDEHNLTVDGDWKNWYTCLKKIDPPCPICSASHRPYYVGMLSVLAKWVDDDGNAHWGKKIFAGKLNGIERIRRQLSKKGNLLYCKYEVARTGDRSEVTGDDYEFVERLTKEQVEALVEGQENVDVNPYDYIEMFAPKEKKELESLMKSGRVAPARKNAGKTTSAAPKAQVSVASDSGDSKASDNPAEEIEF